MAANPYKEPYRLADIAIEELLRKAIRRMNRCKQRCAQMKYDELNVMGAIDSLYQDLDGDNMETFRTLWIARFIEVFRWHRHRRPRSDWVEELMEMELIGLLPKHWKPDDPKTEKKMESGSTGGLLTSPNPVVKYAYEPEVLRKRDRCKEAVNALPDTAAKQDELDKHLTYFEKMTAWYADFVTDNATETALKETGWKYVQWFTQEDDRVCVHCNALNGLVFPISQVPDKPHPGCRCYVIPVNRR